MELDKDIQIEHLTEIAEDAILDLKESEKENEILEIRLAMLFKFCFNPIIH